jgi:GNAT superfamily N-acetyltransferase
MWPAARAHNLPMMSTTIRPVTAADYRQWRPLWDSYNAFYRRSGPTALPEVVTQTTWARFLDPAEPVHAVVAEQTGRLVGLAHYLFHRSTTAVQPVCYLNDLLTEHAARGQGIGQALIEAVAEAARASGAPRLYWLTHDTNATAMKLYGRLAEKPGFVMYRMPLA